MMNYRSVRPLMFVLCFLILAGSALAVQRKWVRLGSRTATDRLDHDVIPVTGVRGDFRRIKLSVARVGVNFHRVTIHYRSGGDQDVVMRDKIPAGGETRAIDLRGGDRVIRSVEFWYDSRSIVGRRAIVTLWGMK